MTKLDRIRNMAYFLVPKSPDSWGSYDFKKVEGRFSADPEERIPALQKTNSFANSKAYSSIVLNLSDKPYCYVHFSNGEDTYGRGDYNTMSITFEPDGKSWGPATEDFLEYYFTNIITGKMKDKITQVFLAEAGQAIKNQAVKLAKRISRYGKIKDDEVFNIL